MHKVWLLFPYLPDARYELQATASIMASNSVKKLIIYFDPYVIKISTIHAARLNFMSIYKTWLSYGVCVHILDASFKYYESMIQLKDVRVVVVNWIKRRGNKCLNGLNFKTYICIYIWMSLTMDKMSCISVDYHQIKKNNNNGYQHAIIYPDMSTSF